MPKNRWNKNTQAETIRKTDEQKDATLRRHAWNKWKRHILKERTVKYAPAKCIAKTNKKRIDIERRRKKSLKEMQNKWRNMRTTKPLERQKAKRRNPKPTDAAGRNDVDPIWGYRKNYASRKQKDTPIRKEDGQLTQNAKELIQKWTEWVKKTSTHHQNKRYREYCTFQKKGGAT